MFLQKEPQRNLHKLCFNQITLGVFRIMEQEGFPESQSLFTLNSPLRKKVTASSKRIRPQYSMPDALIISRQPGKNKVPMASRMRRYQVSIILGRIVRP